jgi:mannose-6-phosphate isomerase-like protein (cupin superfamily)
MVRLIKQGEGERLGLPGRSVLEVVSGKTGSAITFRVVEIPVSTEGEPRRGQHLHHGHEECIYVLRGEGSMRCANGPLRVTAGDVLLVPPEEPHLTSNVGDEPLVLLCFFPTSDIRRTTQDARPAALQPDASSGGRQ